MTRGTRIALTPLMGSQGICGKVLDECNSVGQGACLPTKHMNTTSQALTTADAACLSDYRAAITSAARLATQHADQAARSSEAYRTALRQLMVQGQYCRADADSILAARRAAYLAAKAAALPAVAADTAAVELARARVWQAQDLIARAARRIQHIAAQTAADAAEAAEMAEIIVAAKADSDSATTDLAGATAALLALLA